MRNFSIIKKKLSADMSAMCGRDYTIKYFETLKIHETFDVDR